MWHRINLSKKFPQQEEFIRYSLLGNGSSEVTCQIVSSACEIVRSCPVTVKIGGHILEQNFQPNFRQGILIASWPALSHTLTINFHVPKIFGGVPFIMKDHSLTRRVRSDATDLRGNVLRRERRQSGEACELKQWGTR